MDTTRSSGILLHPTSFPGPDGIGDIGPEAFRFIDFLVETGCQLWQILPLGPTGFGDSPYQCFSAFAGNPYLVSPVSLLDEGLLKIEHFADRPDFPQAFVDFGPVIEWKNKLLDRSYAVFTSSRSKKIKQDFETFKQENHWWLPDFALFMAIKEFYSGGSWDYWPKNLRLRQPDALQTFIEAHQDDIERHCYKQFLFFRQWKRVKQYANERNIKIVGDIPFVIAYDSADVWVHPELFYLDKNSLPTVVAGVPPDYFAKTGQLWGNPLYRWSVHKKEGYQWWLDRISFILQSVDIIRLDHFRGFEAYWEIPFGMPTAEIGRWVKGPGKHFFKTVKDKLGSLPIIAEDLGFITPGVEEMRDAFNLPGMKILQFAFADDPDDAFLPHNYPVNCFAYTGTHDNNTILGWYKNASEAEKDFCRRYLGVSGEDISWSLIRSCWQSVAAKVVTSMQDLLSLDEHARMNLPGSDSGNWSWRMPSDGLNDFVKQRLYETNFLFGRLPLNLKLKIKQAKQVQDTGEVKSH
jgi:4-alpha-glucanotransferase